jgi:site-specific recombinase XerD
MEKSLVLVNNLGLTQKLNLTDELMEGYIRHLQVSKESKRTYFNNIRHFISWLGNRAINEETLLDYRAYLTVNYKATAINSYIVAVKSLFNYLEGLGIRNYAKDLKGVKTTRQHKRDSLTIDQVKSIYQNMNADTEEEARATAMLKLLIGTGLRTIEIINADLGDIQTLGNAKVLYIQGKGFNNAKENKGDYVILQPSILNALQDYLKYRPDAKDNEPLFTSLSDRNRGQRLTTRTVRNIVKGIYKENGLVSERLTTHSTRHTAITLSLIGGATIQEAQALARHTNINTTMIYAHNLNRLESNAEGKLEQLLQDTLEQ